MMAKLTAASRKKLPAKDFAGPGRSFPIEDKAHAVAAERLVGRAVKAGSISTGEATKIKAAAKSKLGQKKSATNSSATHDKHGLTYDDSMTGFHHEGPSHDSGDR